MRARAEVLVNLVTGASVADRGVGARAGPQQRRDRDGDEWLASLDRFGIVSARAVLLEGATLEQNLAMPFTLRDRSGASPEMAERVAALARGVRADSKRRGAARAAAPPAESGPPEMRARAHLARAVALDPALLVLEHPTADVPEPVAWALTRRTSSG